MASNLHVSVLCALRSYPEDLIDMIIDDFDNQYDLILQVYDRPRRHRYLAGLIAEALQQHPDSQIVDDIVDIFASHGIFACRIPDDGQGVKFSYTSSCYQHDSDSSTMTSFQHTAAVLPGAAGFVRLGPIALGLGVADCESEDEFDIIHGAKGLFHLRHSPPTIPARQTMEAAAE